jgi:hypothetical protein
MNDDELHDLKNFALVCFLHDHGCGGLMKAGEDAIRDMGERAGLDERRLERVMANLHKVHIGIRDSALAAIRRRAN